MKEITLGSLPPFEYRQLRMALNYAVAHCLAEAEAYRNCNLPAQDKLWKARASEARAIRARFTKTGRAGKAKARGTA